MQPLRVCSRVAKSSSGRTVVSFEVVERHESSAMSKCPIAGSPLGMGDCEDHDVGCSNGVGDEEGESIEGEGADRLEVGPSLPCVWHFGDEVKRVKHVMLEFIA